MRRWISFRAKYSTSVLRRLNIALAVAVKLVFFVLGLAGVATLWTALLADDGAALSVILNALRVLFYVDDA